MSIAGRFRAHPFYCEENIWHLAEPRVSGGLDGSVALVTNPDGLCAMWNQRAADPGEPVAWDYHVLLITPRGEGAWEVWDLDSRLGVPVEFERYAAASFAPPGALPRRFEPRFRVLGASEYVSGFSSDRSHMRTRAGRYRKPPPPWPPIVREGAPSFLEWRDLARAEPGEVMDLPRFLSRFARR
jgi:hypothetical protein